MNKVHIVKPNLQYINMFKAHGWEVVGSVHEADLVQFTGGSDVSPSLYKEEKHPATANSPLRDEEEERVFKMCKKLQKPMAGICRGGQFLNVMCGGKMFQHINNHAIGGTHFIFNTKTGGMIDATSTHHQMMREGEGAQILATASEADWCENMVGSKINREQQQQGKDIESLFYPEHKVLCFQPHPEFMAVNSACQGFYFSLISEHLLEGVA